MWLLYFSEGLGVGAFITFLFLLWSVGRVNKQAASRADKANEVSAELLRERNELTKVMITRLEGIQNNLSRH